MHRRQLVRLVVSHPAQQKAEEEQSVGAGVGLSCERVGKSNTVDNIRGRGL